MSDANIKTRHGEVFENVYFNGTWKLFPWTPSSGTGSSESNTREYRSLIENFIKAQNIGSVIDLGCGDWTFSQFIDWSNVKYLGIDVAQSVIDANTSNFGNDNVEFRRIDMAEISSNDIPYADLWIVKDVFQHWSLRDIGAFLFKITSAKAYRYILFTDCSGKGPNSDISVGQFRSLDHSQPPFSEYSPKDIYFYNGKTVSVIVGSGETLNWTYDTKAESNLPGIFIAMMSLWTN